MSPEETEDCLFLDVLVPSHIFPSSNYNKQKPWDTGKPKSASAGAAVLVWIDGGGFSAGYKHEQHAAGLVARSGLENGEGIIYVAMNYRVGLLVSSPPSYCFHPS